MIYSILFPSTSLVQSSTNERKSAPDTRPLLSRHEDSPPVPPSLSYGHWRRQGKNRGQRGISPVPLSIGASAAKEQRGLRGPDMTTGDIGVEFMHSKPRAYAAVGGSFSMAQSGSILPNTTP
jgi:hypothetical protein